MDYLATYKVAKDISETIEEMRKKLVEGHEEDLALLQKYWDEYKIADDSEKEAVLDKVSECSKLLQLNKSLMSLTISYSRKKWMLKYVR